MARYLNQLDYSLVKQQGRYIGLGCKIIDNDFHPLPYSERYPEERLDLLKKRPVVIGEGCFLGASVFGESRIVRLEIVSHFCTVILKCSNYGTRQESIQQQQAKVRRGCDR